MEGITLSDQEVGTGNPSYFDGPVIADGGVPKLQSFCRWNPISSMRGHFLIAEKQRPSETAYFTVLSLRCLEWQSVWGSTTLTTWTARQLARWNLGTISWEFIVILRLRTPVLAKHLRDESSHVLFPEDMSTRTSCLASFHIWKSWTGC